MKTNPMNPFAGMHTAIAAVLILSSAAQGQALYWDTNGTAAGFGNFGGAWNGTNQFWNSDATGGAGGSLTATPTSSNALNIVGAGNTGVIVVSGTQTAASIDFANTANLAAMRVGTAGGPVMSLNVTGDITDSGAGGADLRIVNMNLSNAATILTANSITIGVVNFAEESFGNAQYWTTGYNMTMATQFSLGRGNGNYTYTQTAGIITVNDASRGVNFNSDSTTTSNTTATRVHTYIMNGGQLQVGAIGVNTANAGNNNTANNWSSTARLEFNNGTIKNVASGGTLLFQNGLSFKDYTGTGTKDMQYNTSLPLTVALSQTGTHTLNADGAGSTILVTPGAQFVNKTGENGTLNKTGLGSLIFTGGGPVAANSYTGSTTVTGGLVSTDYNQIAGQAASGGTDNLSNGYSAGSQLVLNGGNYSLVGRDSAAAGSATGVTLNAGTAASALNVTVASTAGLVIGQSVTNANLPTATYIRRIINGTTIELNAMSTSTSNQTGQTLTFGAASFNNSQTINSVDLQQAGTATTITVTPGAGTSTTLLSFGDVSGSGGFTKAGTGTLKLTGTVAYTGPTAINAGTLEFASAANQTITANITGTSSGTLVKSGAGILTINSTTGGTNSFNGAVIVNGGTLENGAGAKGLFQASSFTVNSGGILQTGADGLGFDSGPANLTVNAGGIFRGGVQGIGNLTLNGGLMDGTGSYLGVNFALTQNVTVGGSSASTIQGNAGIALNGYEAAAGGTRTFTVADATGNAAADLIVTAEVRNAYGPSNNSTNLQKSGAGTMLLSGTNTYTGTTTVSVGTLLVNGSLGDTAVTVANGATLGGSGTVGTSTVLNTFTVNGTLAPGNSPGILTVNDNLDLNGILSVEISGTTAGTGYDQLGVNGAVDISGSTLSTIFDTFTPVNGNLLFILLNDGTDAITGTFSGFAQDAIVANYGGFDWKISYNADSTANTFTGTPNGNDIALMAVPEPRAALLGGLGLLILLRRRRA
jgi:fibronectin-binding autotransporter adhesin